ncbi:homoserine kinase [bacterium]|nr:homoserine kinase [bacterium]
MTFEIRVPATTANIGPGFDSLGIALSLYNRFSIEPADATSVEGCEEKYRGPDNLFLVAMRRAAALLGMTAPRVRLSIEARIPTARGLGSSAAMIVGGATAALLLSENRDPGRPLSAEERRFILDAAAELEGHPDNAAPAAMGGFCASIAEAGAPEASGRGRVVCARCAVEPSWGFHALVPPFELPTREARAALPAAVGRRDAVFNVGRAALVVLAFEKGDAALLGAACDDRLHQPYRKAMIPGYDEVMDACLRGGAAAAWLSGAGPTLMALTVGAESADRLAAALAPVLAARPEGPWRHLRLSAEPSGVAFSARGREAGASLRESSFDKGRLR